MFVLQQKIAYFVISIKGTTLKVVSDKNKTLKTWKN